MEAATAPTTPEETVPQEPPQAPDEVMLPDAESIEKTMQQLRDEPADPLPDSILKPTQDLYGWQTWVDLPDGGEYVEQEGKMVYVPTCEAERTKRGSCDDSQHFHAWCRLPNQFQHRELQEKANAAKARRVRMLRDPDTDAYAVLEDELDELLRSGLREAMIDQLMMQTAWSDQVQAMADVTEREEYETIQQDLVRLNELKLKTEKTDTERDEFDHLLKHVAGYHVAVTEERKERQEPQRAAYDEKTNDELIDLIRDEKIQTASTEVFLHVYAMWEWCLCTMKADKQSRHFDNIAEVERAPTVVIDGIQDAYNALETADRERSTQGNT